MSAPDWEFWRKMKSVKLWQAAFLSCEIDPDEVDYRTLEYDDAKALKRLRILKASYEASDLHNVVMSEFAARALSFGWTDMPPEFVALAASDPAPIANGCCCSQIIDC